LDEKGKLSAEFSWKQLKCKVSWNIKRMVMILSEENYISSIVNITKDKDICNNKYMDINILTNK
jgi:hypothetical protein